MAALHHNKPPKLDLTAAHAKCAMLLPLSLSFAASKGLYALKGHWLGSGLCLIFLLVPSALSKCPNWCSQHGICTGPGDDAYCICEMGFQGDDCGIREFGGRELVEEVLGSAYGSPPRSLRYKFR